MHIIILLSSLVMGASAVLPNRNLHPMANPALGLILPRQTTTSAGPSCTDLYTYEKCRDLHTAVLFAAPTLAPGAASWFHAQETSTTALDVDSRRTSKYHRSSALVPDSFTAEFDAFNTAFSSWHVSIASQAHSMVSQCAEYNCQAAGLVLWMVATDVEECASGLSLFHAHELRTAVKSGS